MAKLTDKQMIFANEYLIDLNATRAYKKAYSNIKKDSVAKAAASRLLTNVNLKNYIDEQLKKIEDESIADATEVMKYLTAVMRNELTEEVVVVEGEGEGCSSARIVKKDISAKDRNKAAELLGKRYRLFVDKIEADVNQTVVFTGEDELED
ncbi:terminase small subunit [Clostridium sp.]|uniref:terminase small subunit n=1 Tax=Clostridium sp. TaxID=1506 RepID=UPI002914528B|nr:terminase small subunit [Clostridium sp.]MDU3349084.1 terminase small subunit [Clostridium sp.]MDU3406669.1 terminase small subunit [Clostridium sp.]